MNPLRFRHPRAAARPVLLGTIAAAAASGVFLAALGGHAPALESEAAAGTAPAHELGSPSPSRLQKSPAGALADPAEILAGESTLDPVLQQHALEVLKKYEVPYGAVIALEPATGRILVWAEYSHDNPTQPLAAHRARFPAASLIKLVTGAALSQVGAGDPNSQHCYHGGKRKLTPALLVPNPALDNQCVSLATAMGKSANVVFARLAVAHLKPGLIEQWLPPFGFFRPLARDFATEPSAAVIPENPFDFARTAAGFGEVRISPLHAALMAAAVANNGRMPVPVLRPAETPAVLAETMSPAIAHSLAQMMLATTVEGTARKIFRDRRGRSLTWGMPVAGKTGSLAEHNPYRAYDWFTGFAPVENPRIAIASLVINGWVWRIKGAYPAQQVFYKYFQNNKKTDRVTPAK